MTTAIPAGAKAPADHKKKTTTPGDVADDGVFEFNHNGETFRFEKPTDTILTPGFVRKNRREGAQEIMFLLMEQAAGDTALNVLDNLTFTEHLAVVEDLAKHIQRVIGVELPN